jgi:hypothetical protein
MRLKKFDNFGFNHEVKYMWNYIYDFVSTMAYMMTSIWKFISFKNLFYNNLAMSMYTYMPYYRIQILKIQSQIISLWIGGRELSTQVFWAIFSCATLCNQCLRILISIKHYSCFYTNGMRCDCTCNHSNL